MHNLLLKRVRVCLLVLLTLQGAACSSPVLPQYSCDDIQPLGLQSLIYGADAPSQVADKVATGFVVSRTSLNFEAPLYPDPTMGVITWASTYASYNALFYNETLMTVRSIYTKNEGPTLKEIFNCFGQPELYEATFRMHETTEFTLDLWYPSKGIIVTYVEFNGARLPALKESIHAQYILFSESGSIEHMISSQYPANTNKEFTQKKSQELRPWPGGLDQIIIENLLPQRSTS